MCFLENKKYSNYQQMRHVCPDDKNMCKTDEIPNAQNIPGSMFVIRQMRPTIYVICNVAYRVLISLAMADNNHHINPNAGLP